MLFLSTAQKNEVNGVFLILGTGKVVNKPRAAFNYDFSCCNGSKGA